MRPMFAIEGSHGSQSSGDAEMDTTPDTPVEETWAVIPGGHHGFE